MREHSYTLTQSLSLSPSLLSSPLLLALPSPPPYPLSPLRRLNRLDIRCPGDSGIGYTISVLENMPGRVCLTRQQDICHAKQNAAANRRMATGKPLPEGCCAVGGWLGDGEGGCLVPRPDRNIPHTRLGMYLVSRNNLCFSGAFLLSVLEFCFIWRCSSLRRAEAEKPCVALCVRIPWVNSRSRSCNLIIAFEKNATFLGELSLYTIFRSFLFSFLFLLPLPFLFKNSLFLLTSSPSLSRR